MTEKDFRPGDEEAGFRLLDRVSLSDLNLTLLRFRHLATGARWVHLAAADSNNLFAVGFRTPPRDSTGVAHILEHTALCGSRRYPVRDPFFAMLKRSLSTFMNAMTASDWTFYPFATQNRKDFDNLLGIYLDAAFFPLLRERDFRQEGHRLEFTDPTDPDTPLTFRGVVFNEMKGSLASPPSLLGRRLTRHLYPTTTYGHNSGGEPEAILDLTWAGLREFHRNFYHPSNAWFYSYGDLDVRRHLERVQELALQGFEAQPVGSEIPPEERWKAPRRVEETYPLEPGESAERKSFIQGAWLTCDVGDNRDRLGLNLLSMLLVGNPGAPLYRALLESGLGANLAPGTGFHDENRTTLFAAGLQGCSADAGPQVEELLRSTLAEVARRGFSRQRVEGVLHRYEFNHREVVGNNYPYPLALLFRLLGPWLHHDDPLSPLQIGELLGDLRDEVDRGGYFEGLIERWLLDNAHHLTLTLRPDHKHQARQDEALRERLERIEAGLDGTQRREIVEQARELQQAQEQPEDVSCLPTLQREDIPPEERSVPAAERSMVGCEVDWFDQPTNGIGYFLAHFDCRDLTGEQRQQLPIFATLLTQVGAADLDFAALAERMEAVTGGLQASVEVLEGPRSLQEPRGLLEFKGKALVRKQEAMFDLLADLCTDPGFTDLKRIHQVLNQLRTALENAIPGNGHRYAARAAAARLTPGGLLREEWRGIALLRSVRRLAGRSPEELAPLADELRELSEILFSRNRLAACMTGEGDRFEAMSPALRSLLERLPERPPAPWPPPAGFHPEPTRLGLAASVPVCFVTRVFPTVPYVHPDAAALQVLAKLLRAGYLHREIREKGGAYGGFASFDPEAGLFSLLSYRDPHLARTLGVYDRAAEWAAGGGFEQQQVDEAVLSVFSDLDRPISPGGRGYREFSNRRQGLTPELRNEQRRRILAVGRDALTSAAERYLVKGRDGSSVAVIAGEESLKKANGELGGEELAIERI